MTKGKPLSFRTFDLSLIFFKIRESRCTSTRRSWMRRARIALAKLENLTDKDRHEIICVWSRNDTHQIASESLKKVLPRLPHNDTLKTDLSSRYYRRRFNHDGSAIKKPALSGFAANDAVFTLNDCGMASRTRQIVPAGHQHQSNRSYHAAISPAASLQAQGYISLRLHRDSDGLSLPDSGTHAYRHYQHGLAPKLTKKLQPCKSIPAYFTSFLSHELRTNITNNAIERHTRLGFESASKSPIDA